jgi:hypothetical protein
MIRRGEGKGAHAQRLKAVPSIIARGGALAVTALVSSMVQAGSVSFGPHDVNALFSISKSENKNEVVYAVHLDEHCAPLGDAPVFAYWRMREKGAGVLERLLPHEEPAYGIAHQRVIARGSDGGSLDIALHAIPNRHILVQTQRQDTTCRAWSKLPIAGEDAYLYNVHVRLKPFGVDHLVLSGWTTDGARLVHERVQR